MAASEKRGVAQKNSCCVIRYTGTAKLCCYSFPCTGIWKYMQCLHACCCFMIHEAHQQRNCFAQTLLWYDFIILVHVCEGFSTRKLTYSKNKNPWLSAAEDDSNSYKWNRYILHKIQDVSFSCPFTPIHAVLRWFFSQTVKLYAIFCPTFQTSASLSRNFLFRLLTCATRRRPQSNLKRSLQQP